MPTVMNKITGAILFFLPFTLRFIDLKYSAAFACTAATFAAIQEGHYIRTKKHDGIKAKDQEEKLMFRKMRRFKQQISDEECIELLKNEKRGVLSVIGDNGYPYGIPLNHYYNENDGKLYFHGAREGHKLDSIRRCNKVCYTVFDKGYRREGEWALNVKCVVVFGKISLVTDENKAKEICERLCRKFTDDEAYIEYELQHSLARVQCLELTAEHISGKLVNES